MSCNRYLIFLLTGLLLPITASSDELRVAVASNFAHTLKQLKPVFENRYKYKLVIIKGSTGKLFAQIIHGAPYDVFLAADERRPRILEQKGLVSKDSRLTYAIGRIALWSTRKDGDALSTLMKNKFKRIAIANPKIAPYGEAAMQIMRQLNIYPLIKSRLVLGENISQAFQFVQSGNADLGFVAYPDVRRHGIKQYWLPDTNMYQALEQQLVVLKKSDRQIAANNFIQFIRQPDAQKIIQQQGYITP